MSSDAIVYVNKESSVLFFCGKYQAGLCLPMAISIAHHIYSLKPDSYTGIFENPAIFEEDFFSFVENGYGDISSVINLDDETLRFGIFCFVCAFEDEESHVAKDGLLRLLPYYKGAHIPEMANSLIISASNIVDELWEDGELTESYDFFSSGEFVVPFSELSSLKELSYSWRESWDDDDKEDADDRDDEEETEDDAVALPDLDPELWRDAASDKNLALKSALKSASETGHVIEVVLPQNVVIQFYSIPAGSFMMGSPKDELGRDEDEDQVDVVLTQPFWLAKTPLTQEQWEAIEDNNPSGFKGSALPVENVSWNDAQTYLSKLNELQIFPGWKFVLPTEAQWEYACRAGGKGLFPGSSLNEVGWWMRNSYRQTHAVGQKKPNAWGLHDMHGSVYEWCADWYDDTLPGGTDPSGASSGVNRVCRGGYFYSGASACRTASRSRAIPDGHFLSNGFRPALVPSK